MKPSAIFIQHGEAPPPDIELPAFGVREFRWKRRKYSLKAWWERRVNPKPHQCGLTFCAVVVHKTTGLVDTDAVIPAGLGSGCPVHSVEV